MLHYNDRSHVVATGFRVTPSERFDVGIDAVWTSAKAGLDPLALSAPDWAAAHPAQAYDFSVMDQYSNLDTGRLDVTLGARYRMGNNVWIDGRFRRARVNDDEPYLFDASGRASFWSLSVGRAF